MSYLDRIKACNSYKLENYQPFLVEQRRYGWIAHEFVAYLHKWPRVFELSSHGVSLHHSLRTYRERSDAVFDVVAELHRRKHIDTWVGEAYPVTLEFNQEPVMEMERSAILYFGLLGFGIHMNGLVHMADGIHVWVGTRALQKPFYPGKLDQMVAGGQPLGIGLKENLIKECQEEANIPASIADSAQARGAVHYQMETSRGLDVSTIFIYDLWLPEDFEPENTDGEVDSFALVPVEELARLTDETELFKDNCNLVNVDLLIRSGIITPQHEDFDTLTRLIYGTHRQL